jgi:hypothetical protein
MNKETFLIDIEKEIERIANENDKILSQFPDLFFQADNGHWQPRETN